jgi:hypothetical protein
MKVAHACRLEDGVEERNVLKRNLAAYVHPVWQTAGSGGGQVRGRQRNGCMNAYVLYACSVIVWQAKLAQPQLLNCCCSVKPVLDKKLNQCMADVLTAGH